MVFAVDSSDFTIDDVLAMGGKAKTTIARERQITRLFEDFVQEHCDGLSIEDLLARRETKELESVLMNFFHSFRVLK